jgi:hypothetical protein
MCSSCRNQRIATSLRSAELRRASCNRLRYGSIYQTRESRLGHEYETFQLCEQSCVNVFAVGHPHITEGERITVNGQFEADTSFGPFVLHDEILEDKTSP